MNPTSQSAVSIVLIFPPYQLNCVALQLLLLVATACVHAGNDVPGTKLEVRLAEAKWILRPSLCLSAGAVWPGSFSMASVSPAGTIRSPRLISIMVVRPGGLATTHC